MRFHVIARPLPTDALVGGLQHRQHDLRHAELRLGEGRTAIVTVHAETRDSPVVVVEDQPGPWTAVARDQLHARTGTTPQGLADHFDGIVVLAATPALRAALAPRSPAPTP